MIQIDSFSDDMRPEQALKYRSGRVIVDQEEFRLPLWPISRGRVDMYKTRWVPKGGQWVEVPSPGFSASQGYEWLPLGLHYDHRSAEYDLKGRLLTNRFESGLLWRVGYSSFQRRAFDESGIMRVDAGSLGLGLSLVAHHRGVRLFDREGVRLKEEDKLYLLAGLLSGSDATVRTEEAGDRTKKEFLLGYGLLGWSQDLIGDQSLHLLFFRIGLGGADIEKATPVGSGDKP